MLMLFMKLKNNDCLRIFGSLYTNFTMYVFTKYVFWGRCGFKSHHGVWSSYAASLRNVGVFTPVPAKA